MNLLQDLTGILWIAGAVLAITIVVCICQKLSTSNRCNLNRCNSGEIYEIVGYNRLKTIPEQTQLNTTDI